MPKNTIFNNVKHYLRRVERYAKELEGTVAKKT